MSAPHSWWSPSSFLSISILSAFEHSEVPVEVLKHWTRDICKGESERRGAHAVTHYGMVSEEDHGCMSAEAEMQFFSSIAVRWLKSSFTGGCGG